MFEVDEHRARVAGGGCEDAQRFCWPVPTQELAHRVGEDRVGWRALF